MTVSNKHATGEYGISRRNFLQVAGAGASAAIIGSGTGIGRASAADPVTINMLLCNMPWCEAFPTLIADAYRKETNGRVSITAELLPYESLYEKLVLELSSGSSTYDMMTSDCYWVRQWLTNNWVMSFEDMQTKIPGLPAVKVENLHPGNRIYQQYKGKTWGLPGNLSTPVLVWRKDLLEKAGIENAPANWDEYLAAATAMHKDGVAGAMLLPGGQDSCMGDFVSRLMGYVEIKSPEDDFFLNAQNEVIFDQNDGAERAIERMKEILPYCPKGVMNFDYPEASSLMQSGGAAMLVCWVDVMPGFETSPLAGKFGYAVAPTDHYQQQVAAGFSVLGNAASANQEEVYRFMAWMSEGKAYQLMREQGESTLVYLPDIENKEVAAKIPMMKVYEDFKAHGTKKAALFPYRVTNADQVQRIMFEEVVKSLSGEKATKAALVSAKDRIGKVIKG
jgi:multiple sugar transport system substrate-binding protein